MLTTPRQSSKATGNRESDKGKTWEMQGVKGTKLTIEKFRICIKNGPRSVKIEATLDSGASINTIPEGTARILGESRYYPGDQPSWRTYHCTILVGENDERIGRGELVVFKISNDEKVMLKELPDVRSYTLS